jgi:hypothetical protein
MQIRLRYPLLLFIGIITILGFYDTNRESLVKIQPMPKLNAGYYVVLYTNAKLPKDMPAYVEKNRTYIGPLPHIKACHENRVKVRPIYPGVETGLIKINSLNE